ncbi:uncharacterized protein FIBRA_02144 [Fibroporia radiculosa]|uniref:Uncharacterized protein n=1 Tax=Fibroporia radiculosa TaxID=599839 RepID=J4HUF5_9APHY|nr:uncharacterized protein FIBRA_02144 [Fibroporia radiculosa]CCM00117.1 predicted protein [Fibroporia radiculosa]
MYLPNLRSASSNVAAIRRHIPPLPLKDSQFSLDTSGVAGFFGGPEAVSAMATVHVYEGRRWLGWYNSPGAYEISKAYGQLANSRFWDGLYPGPNTDPATLFGLDGKKGPRFRSFQSGTVIPNSGHLGALLMQECEDTKGIKFPGRQGFGVFVTVVELEQAPSSVMRPRLLRTHSVLLASIPIIASAATCVLSGLFQDWYAFSLILFGVIASGIACWVVGSGELAFTHPKPAPGIPPGDGMLVGESGIVILKGDENAVNSITRGRFSLRFKSEPAYNNIGLASMLLTIQFVAQLLLVPQATLFGQILFVISMAVSWGYNSWLSSLDKDKIQREILMQHVLSNPPKKRFDVGTRTTMAVLACLLLQPNNPKRVLEDLIPNDTEVWNRFKRGVSEMMEKGERIALPSNDLDGLDDHEQNLLNTFYDDAQVAVEGFSLHFKST